MQARPTLEVFKTILRYINSRFTYLLTYFTYLLQLVYIGFFYKEMFWLLVTTKYL